MSDFIDLALFICSLSYMSVPKIWSKIGHVPLLPIWFSISSSSANVSKKFFFTSVFAKPSGLEISFHTTLKVSIAVTFLLAVADLLSKYVIFSHIYAYKPSNESILSTSDFMICVYGIFSHALLSFMLFTLSITP